MLAEDVQLFRFEDDDDDDDEYINGIDDGDDDYFDKENNGHHHRGDTSITSIGNKLLGVEGFKSTRGGGKQQKFEFKIEPVSGDDRNEIESAKQVQKKIDNLEEKINKLSNDVTNRINIVEESLKEILKLVKEEKQT